MATEAMDKKPNLAAIKLLGAMCLDSNKTMASMADQALYQKIIIPLCDDFTSQGVQSTNRILATLIWQAAQRGAPSAMKALEKSGLHNAEAILARHQRLQQNSRISDQQTRHLKQICILSRVTIGADISITSIIIERLHQHFPDSAITLIGPDHLPQLFCHAFLDHQLFEYQKETSHYARLNHWVKLQQITRRIRADLTDEEFILIDPDTRISQLGLVPLAPEQCTYILPSRIDQPEQTSLATITNRWLDGLLKENIYTHPSFKTCQQPAPMAPDPFTVTINFGVGGDSKKRISLKFEQHLIMALIQQGNTKIILDSGKGPQEIEQSVAIERFLKKHGILKKYPDSFIRIQDTISTLANHIAAANLFIGYDSCSGHIATSSKTPTIICFKGAPNPRFYLRWQPQNQLKLTTCIEVSQKQLTETQRSLLIQHIIDIASSHH